MTLIVFVYSLSFIIKILTVIRLKILLVNYKQHLKVF